MLFCVSESRKGAIILVKLVIEYLSDILVARGIIIKQSQKLKKMSPHENLAMIKISVFLIYKYVTLCQYQPSNVFGC